MERLKDRVSAGKKLAELLQSKGLPHPFVIALPRGGVPVAREVAEALQAPLDVVIVRKLGAPANPEFAVGAISEEGFVLLNHDAIDRLDISNAELKDTLNEEARELMRRVKQFRSSLPLPALHDYDVILVDDGLATGFTAAVAADFLKSRGVRRLILAAPVASKQSIAMLKKHVDEVITLADPEPFYSVGTWYEAFPQLTDEEVLRDLRQPGRSAEMPEPRLGF